MPSIKIRFTLYDLVMLLLVLGCMSFSDVRMLRLASEALAVVMSVLYCGRCEPVIKKYSSKWLVWTLIFGLYALVSTLWTSSRNSSAVTCTMSFLQAALVIFCILIYCRNSRKWNNIATFIVLAAIITCLRIAAKVPLSMWGNQIRISKYAKFMTNATGIMLSYAAILLMMRFKSGNKSREKKLLIAVLAAVFILTAFSTGTKKVILILSAALVTYLLSKADNPKRLFWQLLASACVLVGIYLLIIKIPLFYNLLGYRVQKLVHGLQGGETDGSTRARIYLAQEAFNVFKSHPLFGIGQDGFRYVSRRAEYAHVNYLELGANLGLVGLVAYYSLHVSLLKKAVKAKTESAVPLVLMCSILVTDAAMVSYSSEGLALLLGFAMSGLALLEIEKKQRTEL